MSSGVPIKNSRFQSKWIDKKFYYEYQLFKEKSLYDFTVIQQDAHKTYRFYNKEDRVEFIRFYGKENPEFGEATARSTRYFTRNELIQFYNKNNQFWSKEIKSTIEKAILQKSRNDEEVYDFIEKFPHRKDLAASLALYFSNDILKCKYFSEVYPEQRDTAANKAFNYIENLDSCYLYYSSFPEEKERISVKTLKFCKTLDDYFKFSDTFPEKRGEAAAISFDLCNSIDKTIKYADYFTEERDEAAKLSVTQINSLSDCKKVANYFKEKRAIVAEIGYKYTYNVSKILQHLDFFPDKRPKTRIKACEIVKTLDECETIADVFPEWRDSIRVKAESICETIGDWIKFSNYFVEAREKASYQALYLADNIEEYSWVAEKFPARLGDARLAALDICYEISDFSEFANRFPEWSDKAKLLALKHVNSAYEMKEYASGFFDTNYLPSLWEPDLFNRAHNFSVWEQDEVARAMEIEDSYENSKMMHYYFLPPNSYAALTFMELPDGYYKFTVYDETNKKWLKATNVFPMNIDEIPIFGGALYANVYAINPIKKSRLLKITVESRSKKSVEYGIHSVKSMYSSQKRIESWILTDIGGYVASELDFSNLDWILLANIFGSDSGPDYLRNVIIDLLFETYVPENYQNKIYLNELKSFLKELTKNVD